MAPSASMLFLSYHQLHSHRPTTEAGASPPRREEEEEEEEAAPGPGGFRMSVRSVLSLGLFQRRPEAAVPAERKTTTLLERAGAGEETKSAAAAVAAEDNKELERKFEEAVRLSCWSS